jgi:outer membrane protein OmpA-like peptidoglycan-associated protein
MLRITTSLVTLVALVAIALQGSGCICQPPVKAEIIGTPPPEIPAPPPEAPPPAPVQRNTPAPRIELPEPLPPPQAATHNIPAPVILSLRDLAAQYPNLLSFDEKTGRLRFTGDLLFDSGSATLKAEARTALTKLGVILAADVAKETLIDIIGHTDSQPVAKPATIKLLKDLKKSANNQGLSEARAEAVAEVLTAAKVSASRITTKGVGEAHPVADNKTADGRAKNRRVELFITGPGGTSGAAAGSAPTVTTTPSDSAPPKAAPKKKAAAPAQ